MLKRCRFRYASRVNKLDLAVVCVFKIDEQGYDEEPRDLDERPFYLFLLLVVNCMLLG
jgi:hypothetical protein